MATTTHEREHHLAAFADGITDRIAAEIRSERENGQPLTPREIRQAELTIACQLESGQRERYSSICEPPEAWERWRKREGYADRSGILGVKLQQASADALRADLVANGANMGATEHSVKAERLRQAGGWWPNALSDWETDRGRQLAAEIAAHRQ